jgi:CheY-like chemotaxis protein
LVEILTDGGLHAEAVPTTSLALEKLNTSLFHLLILDVQLEEGDTTNTEEGMHLLRNLHERKLDDPIKVIMLTAYSTPERMRQAFRAFHVIDFLSKDDFNDQAFLTIIRNIFADELKINLDLQVHWDPPHTKEQILQRLEIAAQLLQPASSLYEQVELELEDLLSRLFYDAESLLIKPLTPGYSGTGVVWVQPFYVRGSGQAVVMKFGDCSQIEEEHQNFKLYIQKFIGGGRSTNVQYVRRTPRLGGIVYSLLGVANNQLQDFGTFYRNADIAAICDVLDGLFLDTCKSWYANPGHLQPYNLTQNYHHSFALPMVNLKETFPKLLAAMPELLVQPKLRMKLLGGRRTFTNPLLAMQNRTFVRPTYVCITHGDVSQNNFLVDAEKHTWLIDFQSTGLSHFLRDVAILDSVIRLQLLKPEEVTMAERLQMEEALYNIKLFSQLEQLKSAFSTENPALAKAYATIVHLRNIMLRMPIHNTNDDLSEYYIALLYSALNTLRFSSLAPAQREHALICSSLLVDRLDL